VKDAAEVLDDLEAVLEDLEEAASRGAVLVEGLRDAAALRAMAVEGNLEVLNRGVGLLRRCEELAAAHGQVSVLTDWDEKGDKLAKQLEGGLRRGGVVVELASRERLRRLTRGSCKAVEELPSFLRRVRAAAQAKGPVRTLPESWREKKAEKMRLSESRKRSGAPPGRRP
jgi:5S rRNA maturation endonuclease (ribonuclease M5)